ncbi:hypothetical protein [Methylobacterium aquaticum]|jgi:hypothetical protein|uniref:Uncharacterized protein n=1 Tax=Methylobacterium aquaticum TaxID=270351 RepID=A0A0J6SU82_9HYPH|nr:hypothetical protein [Methylobacterium aquaticum]KMO37082.1 hypothetical protein VP06_08535 [Methylobacterium aquaticum]
MILSRPLARLLAAVIVMIAACVSASVVGASAAQAHQGQGHQGHGHRGHAPHATSFGASAVTALTLAEAHTEAHMAAQAPRLTAADPDEAPAGRPCNGLCCLMGASCCVPGLLPEGLAAFPSLTAARRLTAAAVAVPAGIVPDSPARPPRSFA